MSQQSSSFVYVVGVGLTKFIKPSDEVDYPLLALSAATKALLDASLTYTSITTGIACYCYGDSTCGQRAFYQLGLTGIPIYNVNNNCATGSSGLHLARSLLLSSSSSSPQEPAVILVLGFEKMSPGALKSAYTDRANPTGLIAAKMSETQGWGEGPVTAQMFGNAGREYMDKYGATSEDFAEIARVNHAHAMANPYAQSKRAYTLKEVRESQMLHDPITKLQACPPSSGAGAAVLVNQAWLDQHPDMRSKAVRVAGQAMVTDSPSVYGGSAMDLVGYDMSSRATRAAFKEAGRNVRDVGVVELHDCFSANEMVTLPALGLCEEGDAHLMVRRGDITYGGRLVVNPSGGLIGKGHPLGATGLAQCAELVWQLRGWAGEWEAGVGKDVGGQSKEGRERGVKGRQVEGVKVALQHNLGLGGAAVVTLYERADGEAAKTLREDEVQRMSGVGYNPAAEAREVTVEDVRKVQSTQNASEWAMGGVLEHLKTKARL